MYHDRWHINLNDVMLSLWNLDMLTSGSLTADEILDQHPEDQVYHQPGEGKAASQVAWINICKYSNNVRKIRQISDSIWNEQISNVHVLLAPTGSPEARTNTKEGKEACSLCHGLWANYHSWTHIPVLASECFWYCVKKRKKKKGCL